MGVSLTIYRAVIGMFNNTKFNYSKFKILILRILRIIILCIFTIFLMILLIIAGDIELNPGPKTSYFTLGHINARSLVKDDKFDEISSFILDKKFDLFAISETWFDCKISNESYYISGYCPIVRKDRRNMRGGVVALYETQSLAVKRRNDLVEIKLHKLTMLCGVCYRPPNNSQYETTVWVQCFAPDNQ